MQGQKVIVTQFFQIKIVVCLPFVYLLFSEIHCSFQVKIACAYTAVNSSGDLMYCYNWGSHLTLILIFLIFCILLPF